MSECIACDRPNADPSKQMPHMHVRCWLSLPEVTRNLYLHGGLDLRRLTEAAQRVTRSVKNYGGGSRRWLKK